MSTPLVQELEAVTTKYAALVNEVGKEGPTAEQSAELDSLHTKGLELRGKIEEEKALSRTKDMALLHDYLERPLRSVTHPVNDDRDGRKVLSDMGWECKNGIVLAPTSLGKTVEMFGEEVLFGPIPTDDEQAANFFRMTRAAFQPTYRKAYEKLLRNCTRYRSESMAFAMMTGEEQKALSEGSDAGGGFLVPPDVQAEILVRVAQRAIMRRLARVVTTSRDALRFPRVAAHATSGSIYSSGFVGGWVGETPAFAETDPAFGMFEVSVKKLRVATKLSNDFLSDAVANVLAFLAQNGAENMALVEDDGFINGTGDALQPQGILNGGATTVDVEGSTANYILNTTAATGTAPKLITLAYTLPSQYAQGASWLMKRSIEGAIRKLVDASGRFMWPPLSGSGFAGTPPDLLSYPVYNSEFMPTDGTDANKVLVFGDISAYVIAQRAQITTVVLRERFADTDQTGIILFERVGGALWNEDAIRIGIV